MLSDLPIITQVLVISHFHLLALNRLPQFFTLKSNHGQSHLGPSSKPFPPSEVEFLAECSLKKAAHFFLEDGSKFYSIMIMEAEPTASIKAGGQT